MLSVGGTIGLIIVGLLYYYFWGVTREAERDQQRRLEEHIRQIGVDQASGVVERITRADARGRR